MKQIKKILDNQIIELDEKYYDCEDKQTAFLEICAYNKAIYDIKKLLLRKTIEDCLNKLK